MTWIEAEMRNSSTSSASEPTLYDRVLALVEPPLLESVLRQNRGNRAWPRGRSAFTERRCGKSCENTASSEEVTPAGVPQ